MDRQLITGNIGTFVASLPFMASPFVSSGGVCNPRTCPRLPGPVPCGRPCPMFLHLFRIPDRLGLWSKRTSACASPSTAAQKKFSYITSFLRLVPHIYCTPRRRDHELPWYGQHLPIFSTWSPRSPRPLLARTQASSSPTFCNSKNINIPTLVVQDNKPARVLH